MALFSRRSLLALVGSALATPPGPGYGKPPGYSQTNGWDLKQFTTLVSFGDSYTDDNRLNYFIQNNGSAPPVGWVNSGNYYSASGGRTWPQYVAQYANSNVYNYAVSGAVCSNDITPRNFSAINDLFPAMEQYEIPAYIADSQYTDPSTGQPFMTLPPEETVYSIWIGTNDLGNGALFSDSQVPGTNTTSYTDCVFEQMKRIYDNGGRYFVLQNVAPLNLAPLYATPENEGLRKGTNYWPDKPDNLTKISFRMMESVVTVNEIYELKTPFAVKIQSDFEGAKVAIMDMHALFTDIYTNPSQYLNGTAPPNVTGYINRCNATGGDCVRDASPDSFLWFDPLHPSEQTDRVIAREFVEIVKGGSPWARYWG